MVVVWVAKLKTFNLKTSLNSQLSTLNYNLGGYSAEVPPLPIPNRVVKLSIADGTALRCGRVGSRHFERVPLGTLFFLRLHSSTMTQCRSARVVW